MALSHAILARLNVLHAATNPIPQSAIPITHSPVFGHDIRAPIYTTLPMMSGPLYQPLSPFSSFINPSLHATPRIGTTPPFTSNVGLHSSANTPLDLAMEKKLAKMESMIQRIPVVLNLLRKSLPHSYVDSPFVDSIALVEMPKKFHFPNMKSYDGTIDPTDHITSYKQRMFIAAITCEQREACMCNILALVYRVQPSNGTRTYQTTSSLLLLSSWTPS